MRHCFYLLFLYSSFGLTQQVAQYSQWSFAPGIYNPAYSGIKKYPELKLFSRMQWLGIAQAPSSSLLLADFQIPAKRTEIYSARHGMSIRIENDHLGPFTNNQLNFSYAFHKNVTQDNRFSMGLALGLKQFIFENSTLHPLIPDPSIAKNSTQYTPTFMLGSLWNTKSFYIGLSLDQITAAKWNNVGTSSNYSLSSFLTSGGKIMILPSVTLLPAICIMRSVNSSFTTNANLFLDFSSKIKIGAGYRNKDAFIGFFQININKAVSIGYSVDYVISELHNKALFSHELTFSFKSFEEDEKLEKLSCPLF
jgi:type IX secretion system PorP/SprF family membrane protein